MPRRLASQDREFTRNPSSSKVRLEPALREILLLAARAFLRSMWFLQTPRALLRFLARITLSPIPPTFPSLLQHRSCCSDLLGSQFWAVIGGLAPHRLPARIVTRGGCKNETPNCSDTSSASFRECCLPV